MRTLKAAAVLVLVGALANGCSSAPDAPGSGSAHATVSTGDERTIATVRLERWALGMQTLTQRGFDVAGVDLHASEVDLVVDADELAELESAGFTIVREVAVPFAAAPEPGYKSPAAVKEILHDFGARFPSLATPVSIGQSHQGRDIWALRIATRGHDPKKPAILFNGMHHARELMTVEVPLDTIETLLTGYGADPRVTHWVDANEIWVVPMLNVDGNQQVWAGDSMWRKNARGCPASGACASRTGVDINRNYPYGWGSCNGSSSSQSADNYRGPSAASEPETQAMMRFVDQVRPVLDLSYHSYSELVLYPYGCSGQYAQTRSLFEDIGGKMAARLPRDQGTGTYRHGTPWQLLYSADGGDIDWMYSEFSVAAFAIELNGTRQGFRPSYATWRAPTVTKLRAAWQLLLDRLDESGVRGFVHGPSGDAVADARVDLVSSAGTESRRLNADGSFHFLVAPGTYRVEVVRDDGTVRRAEATVAGARVNLDLEL